MSSRFGLGPNRLLIFGGCRGHFLIAPQVEAIFPESGLID